MQCNYNAPPRGPGAPPARARRSPPPTPQARCSPPPTPAHLVDGALGGAAQLQALPQAAAGLLAVAEAGLAPILLAQHGPDGPEGVQGGAGQGLPARAGRGGHPVTAAPSLGMAMSPPPANPGQHSHGARSTLARVVPTQKGGEACDELSHPPTPSPVPPRHSLRALQRPGHGLHQRVEALSPLLISLQPVNNCANDGRPPLGDGVGACGAGGMRERGVRHSRRPHAQSDPPTHPVWGGEGTRQPHL